jgi:hypothetical protein
MATSGRQFRLHILRLPAIFLMLLLALTLFSCRKKEPEDTRSFYMGTTPWPADFNQSESDRAYHFINNNCDLVSHHFDEGIPYEEAYLNTNWPAGLVTELENRKNKPAPGKAILLSSSALDLSRKQKAAYSRFSDQIGPATKDAWMQLPVNDPKVVTAYVNYVIFLAGYLKPSFINYAVESNADNWNPADFLAYKDFLEQVFQRLKAEFPNIPVMVSMMSSENQVSLDYTALLLPFSDYLALSAYPYTHISSSADGNTNPALFPDSYFNRYLNLAPGKPICFAETA